jgi:hypothetical protein
VGEHLGSREVTKSGVALAQKHFDDQQHCPYLEGLELH